MRKGSGFNLIKGIPTKPIFVLEYLTQSNISPFVARNAVWGGVALVASSNAPERATRNLLRPKSNIIELGPYNKTGTDILSKLNSTDGYIRHNGFLIKNIQNKKDYIKDLCQKLKIKRAFLHLHNQELISLMKDLGLKVLESLPVYKRLGNKSYLNTALGNFSKKNKDSTIGRFGVNFQNIDQIADEIDRLNRFNLQACVKFDNSSSDPPLDSGAGVYFFPNFGKSTGRQKIKQIIREKLRLRKSRSKKLIGVVQIYVPNPKIISISSGQDDKGNYSIYEAHTQIQFSYSIGQDKAITADGGIPVTNSMLTSELFNDIWPQLVKLYISHNVTGDQNINLVVLPKKLIEVARKIYSNGRLSPIIPIDLNPRPISGVKRIMGRFSEETNQPVNYNNFAARSLYLNPFFAANPHLIYKAAKKLGLKAGINGNMSFTNLGTLIPDRIRSHYKNLTIKTYVQNVADPLKTLDHLEEMINYSPSKSLTANDEIIRPEEVPDADKDEKYRIWLQKRLIKVLK
jgi:hypothetical protein